MKSDGERWVLFSFSMQAQTMVDCDADAKINDALPSVNRVTRCRQGYLQRRCHRPGVFDASEHRVAVAALVRAATNGFRVLGREITSKASISRAGVTA